MLKVRADWAVTPQFFLGANVLTSAGAYARGDENNQDVNGQLPGYTLVNLDARYLVSKAFEVFARVEQRCSTGGTTTSASWARTSSPAPIARSALPRAWNPAAEQFRGPGAPRGVWVGVRYSFGGQSEGAARDTD